MIKKLIFIIIFFSSVGIAYAETISDYSKAIELDPKDATAYYNRATVYKKQGKYVSATIDFAKARELDPNFTSNNL